MGAAESNPVRNMDKRTARRTHRLDFMAAIERYRSNPTISNRHSQLIHAGLEQGANTPGLGGEEGQAYGKDGEEIGKG